MELPHRKPTQTTLMLTAPRLITERLKAQKEHFPVPGRGYQRESRTIPSDVLPAVQAPGRIRARLGEPGGAIPARFPHRAVCRPLQSLPGPPSLSWNTPSRQVHLPGPGNCAKAGYLSQVGGRRAGCWKEAACTARYVAGLWGEGLIRGCFQSLHSSRGPTSAQRGTADEGGHTVFAQLKPRCLSLQNCLQVRTTRNQN